MALFSLGKFKSQKSFGLIIELVGSLYSAPITNYNKDFLGDVATEQLPCILAACYDGDLSKIEKFMINHDVIEA